MASALLNVTETAPSQQTTKRNVVVTGFGPFYGHPVNASWEAVKLLPGMNIENEADINLVIEEIPVVYNAIEKRIPELWKQYNPLLVIHVGVSNLARNLTLERCARQSGYKKCDIKGQKPLFTTCFGSEKIIYSSLDILDLSGKINTLRDCVQTSVSTDAGRYLCEYTYYTSLSQDHSRCLFVHVPDLQKPYTSEQTALGLCRIIKLLVEQLRAEKNQFNLDNFLKFS
ncbi:pyroglutamyl-peptidase 1 isoform X2 [Lycorma delicatula]|uniref:pyroglutamyl-peptidase 1 isoform X2 n=1 Tax=Lycorma delicatula TaxID=130591 RepID=UPI003F50FFB9